MRHVVVILALAGLLSGCGSEDGPASDGPATTMRPETSTPASTSEPKPPPKPGPTTRQIVIAVDQGRPRGGIKRPTLAKGEKVVLVVRADVGNEVHVHGYDVTRALTPGKPARIPITATLAGRFEVELHDPDALLAVLEVRP